MHRKLRSRAACILLALIQIGFLTSVGRAEPGDKPEKPDKPAKAAKKKHDWGRQKNETDEKYQRRRAGMIKRCKKDELGLYAIKNIIFLVRTDISPEFTVELALYTEELHRAYQNAFSKMGAPPSKASDMVEVVCYEDRGTYVRTGGDPNSGGNFDPVASFRSSFNRPAGWPSGQFRLSMFTSGVREFDKWEKSVMKHEAAHMELQLRLGYLALDAPRWWNEGMAACFEYWDFSKTTEENFALIPNRGRYAPFVRRIWETDRWKDFNYIWNIDGAKWHHDMAETQGYLNYCEAWSLAAFMFNQGVKGKTMFNRVFTLTVRIGSTKDRRGRAKRGWEEEFSPEDRAALEKAWVEWVKGALPKEKRIKGEAKELVKQGFDPDATSLVQLSEDALRQKAIELKLIPREKEKKGKKGSPPKSS